ncbi:MAG: trehalase family glycosidase [Clostridiales bacterium]|nr:trehalase family glycosidase [Clostridiales bacterium]
MAYSESEQRIIDYSKNNFTKMLREPTGYRLNHKFIVPGSVYSQQLWDWDSWLTDIALCQLNDMEGITDQYVEYEKGCILNFLDSQDEFGRVPIVIYDGMGEFTGKSENEMFNIHKPCLAQHAAFIVKNCGDAKWLEPVMGKLKKFVDYYIDHFKHESGIYFWYSDEAIGVDNDPCTFYRPNSSSGSIYLNCFMYKELLATAYLCEKFGMTDDENRYNKEADDLKQTVRDKCWDERDGFYYSVDLNLRPIDTRESLHSGCPRHWNTLIQRIDVWSGFMAMWAGIANYEQAGRMVKHYLRKDTFYANYGVRTLGKSEKMYSIIKSGNPSCWLGPIWGISNYMVFKGFVRYGFTKEASDLANKTVELFSNDIKNCGQLHEYYHPDTGEGVNNPGFQNWNLLSLNMIAWLENENVVSEF